MKKLLLVILLLLVSGCHSLSSVNTRIFYDYFDTVITIHDYSSSDEQFRQYAQIVQDSLARYDQLFSIYEPGENNLYAINRNAGIKAVECDEELIELLKLGQELYELSDGKLNIMAGSLTKVWKAVLKGERDVPTSAELSELNIAMETLQIEGDCVYISDPGASIDVGALAKGYVGRLLKQELEAAGAECMGLDLGGNIVLVGQQPGSFTVGIRDPFGSDYPLCQLQLASGSLVTSANNLRCRLIDGVLYHHIIDPLTRYPAATYVSVTVLSEDSAWADGLSTALFCLDQKTGLAIVESMEGTEALWVYPDGRQQQSSGFGAYLKK